MSDASASTGEDGVNTTIPITSVSATLPPTTPISASSPMDEMGTTAPAPSTTNGETAVSSTTSAGSSSAESTEGGTTNIDDATSTSDGDGVVAYTVGWCNLQYPPSVPVESGEIATPATPVSMFARIYIEGLTDVRPTNDPTSAVMVDFGYGADGSDPASESWSWLSAEPNPGWNGASTGQPANDEYWIDEFVFAESGVFDFAARVSADGGETWSYCDRNGLTAGGYTPDQAGDATISELET